MVARRDLRLVGPTPSLDELPEVLTVEEAAKVLRIGRGPAYDLAQRFLDSGGREGLPVVRLRAQPAGAPGRIAPPPRRHRRGRPRRWRVSTAAEA